MNGPQTFEMPSSDGRTIWTVTFELSASLVTARLVAGARRHRADFVVDRDEAELWRSGGLLPQDEAEWPGCYLRAAIHYCRRHLDEILRADRFERRLQPEDLPLASEVHSSDTLQSIEHDIDDVLDGLPDLFAFLDQTRRKHGFGFFLDREVPVAWKRHAPNLRRMGDLDERYARAYEQAAEFYEIYQRHLGETRYPKQISEIAADLHQANTLGHHALRAVYAARLAARAPVTQGSAAHANGGWPADRAVHLRRIAMLKVRCFEHVDVLLEPPADPAKGQWIVLLGENGMGKTTILRALALALLPEDAARNHVYELSARAGLIRRARDGRDVPAQSAQVDVETGPGGAATLSIFQQRPRETLNVAAALAQKPLVLGYGCRRGSALGDVRRESNTDYLLGTETLFNEDARVIHADTWLRDLRDQDGDVFESVCRMLSELLLGVERITVEPGGTWVEGPVIGRVPLAGLSDGYLTTLGWLVDVLARWIAYAAVHKLELGPDFHKRMPCVVLIDEIDLHLHPRWQTEVITKLRDTFPMTTFVATTHNPLTLHGTQPGEVHVIRANEDGALEIVQKDLPPGIRTDELLTGEWFGLASTLDADTQKLLNEHFALLQQGRPEDDPERVELEEELRTRLGHFAATPAEKLAHELVAEQFDPAAKPVTDEDRKRLRAKYAQRLRDAAQAITHGRQGNDP